MEGISIELSAQGIQWLHDNHPDLSYSKEQGRIYGELFFRMYYADSEPDSYVINPNNSYQHGDGIIIEDCYEIEVDLSQNRFIPFAKEVGGKILKTQEKWGISNLADLHVYHDGSLCLCVGTEEHSKMPNGFKLEDFFTNLLIPFFYYQSYYHEYGKEPWKSYSHDYLGILESYLNFQSPQSRNQIFSVVEYLPSKIKEKLLKNGRLKGHHPCLCGSGVISRRCHKRAFWGYEKLRHDYHNCS